jgi:general stress protein 26
MNQKIKQLFYTLFILVLMPSMCFGQIKEKQSNSAKENLLSAAREIIKDAKTCVLITLDKKSRPMARIMDPFPPESDFTVWFGTNSKSRKIQQLKNNPTVTLYYQDNDASGYVVIHGKAVIVNDKKEKKQRWKKTWEAFYPNKKEGYLLIKVIPESMEILSYPRGIIGDKETWQTPVVIFD